MERLLLKELLNWKQQKVRKPVLLDGARQVGKSYILKNLLGSHFDKTHVVDFLKTPEACHLFEEELDADIIINKIGLLLETEINPKEDLIIFDEIGECKRAITSLKFIAEDKPDWFVCASGSNIGLLDSFPVGKVHGLTLMPMNIEEFVMNVGSKVVYSAFKQFDRGDVAHMKLWDLLVDYFFVGGMPEVVQKWIDLKNEQHITKIRQTRQIQKDILSGYQKDFAKYSDKINALHIEAVFKNSAIQLQRTLDGNSKRFFFRDIIPKKSKYRDFENVISWLEKTHLLSKSYVISSHPDIPLKAFKKDSLFKLFFLDIGLLGCELNLTHSILNNKDISYKGFIAENFIQNELLSYGHEQSYTWHTNAAEIEFIIELNNEIVPIEVKSGTNTGSKSMTSYKDRYEPSKTIKLVGSKGSDNKKDIVLPLYYASKVLKKD